MPCQESVFLFDIDGTLLKSGGAGQRAMNKIMSEMYGLVELAQLDVHGRTDRAIIADLFHTHSLELNEAVRREFTSRYHEQLEIELPDSGGETLPGVFDLLTDLLARDNVHLGLLTGNSFEGASTKLKHFQLDHFFAFGGYGGDVADRGAVAKAAAENAARHVGVALQELTFWVVGDTIHDIRCAREIGAFSIAVETGGFDRQSLLDEKPDVLLADLTARGELTRAMLRLSPPVDGGVQRSPGNRLG